MNQTQELYEENQRLRGASRGEPEAEELHEENQRLRSFTRRTRETMAVNLSRNGLSLMDAYKEVVDGRMATNW